MTIPIYKVTKDGSDKVTARDFLSYADTNIIMAPGNCYDIGAFIRDENGNQLSGVQVQELVASGKLKVRDSRTGSIVTLTQLANGNFRITGRNEGTAYIVYEMGGTHASVCVDVQRGAR